MRYRDRVAIEAKIAAELAKRKAELEAQRSDADALDLQRRIASRLQNPNDFSLALGNPAGFVIWRFRPPEHAAAAGAFERVIGASPKDLRIARADEPVAEDVVEVTSFADAHGQARSHASRLEQSTKRSRFAGIATR